MQGGGGSLCINTPHVAISQLECFRLSTIKDLFNISHPHVFLPNLALFMKEGLVPESRTRCCSYPASKSILFNVISLLCTTIMARLGYLAVLLHVIQVNAVSWEEASSTSATIQTTSWSPIQTSKPPLITASSSSPSPTYEPPNICGWIDHNPGSC